MTKWDGSLPRHGRRQEVELRLFPPGASKSAQPLRPPHLDRRDVEFGNQLAVARPPLACSLGDLDCQVQLLGGWFRPVPDGAACLEVGCAIGKQAGRVRMPSSLADLLIAQIDSDLCSGGIEGDCLAFALALVLAQLFDRLEVAVGHHIALMDADALICSDAYLTLAFSVRLPDQRTLEFALILENPDRTFLLDLILQWPTKPRDWFELPLTASMQLGVTKLKAQELQSLRPKDIVLVDDAPFDRQTVSVVVGGRMVCWGWIEGDRVRIESVSERMYPIAQEQEDMTNGAEVSTDSDLEGSTEPDELPVTLSFELGRPRITLGELRSIGNGYTFDLGRSLEDPVDICANGKLIGRGELVEIAESLGVRVTRIFGHE